MGVPVRRRPLPRGRPLTQAAWFYPLALAVPFLIGIAVLKGLTVEIDTFHGSDARIYQLPTIRQFARQLPGVDLGDYPAAQTPLFHLVMAVWGKVVGFEPWRLRLLNVAFSYLAVLALFRLLWRQLGVGRTQAFALALVFALSPYFFGASFAVLTDNLALLFGVLAVGWFLRARREGALAPFALGCAAMAGAVLTRQSFLWLAPIAAWALLPWPLTRRKLAGALMVLAALSPFAALVIDWGALVPPGSDPASCGLCQDRAGLRRSGLTLRSVLFTVSLVGLYAAAIWGPGLLRRARELRPRFSLVVLSLVGGGALLAVSQLAYRPATSEHGADAGYLWKLSDQLPEPGGSSLLFWALVPLGAVALALLLSRVGIDSLPTVFLAGFLLAAVPVGLVYQKYFDPYVLWALAMLARPADLRVRADYAGLALLAAAFVAYALSFAG
ncbi:MAG: ArnT family glycosyltransferase [Thermoleophilaceae bacterium]